MKIEQVQIRGFRSLANVDANLSDYSCLIGKNDSGKSSFLQALELLFNPDKTLNPNDRSTLDGINECSIEARLTGVVGVDHLTTTGVLRIRRVFGEKSELYVWGRVPKSSSLQRLQKGDFLKGDLPKVKDLSAEQRELIQSLVAAVPGSVKPDIWKGAFAAVERAGLIEWTDGWVTLDPEQLRGLVRPVVLLADARIEEEIADRGNSALGSIGDMLVRSATRQHQGLADALTELKSQLAQVSTRQPDGQWQLPEFNLVEELVRREIHEFDKQIKIRSDISVPKVPNLDFGLKLDVSDGCVDGFRQMGHGLRRSLVFALLRVVKQLRDRHGLQAGNDSKGPLYLFLVEEPEIYLHPQAERRRAKELQQISNQDDCQVVLCTHSAFFVDLTKYDGILRFNRPERLATTVLGWSGPRLPIESEKTLQTTYFFDPTRAAMLFADLVILVEGQTEKVTVPPLAERLGLDVAEVEVVDCGGNGNIPTYQRVLEEFGIRYVAWLDSKEKGEVEKAKNVRSLKFGRIVLTKRNWEHMAKTSSQDKAFSSWHKYVHSGVAPNEMMEQRIRAAYAWADYFDDPEPEPTTGVAGEEQSLYGKLGYPATKNKKAIRVGTSPKLVRTP